MTTFALVHGAWHGGWCWAAVAAELEGRGHRAVAPDLPCEEPDATFGDYADVVAGALRDDDDDDVVVVGHSLGGLTAALVPARRPVRAIAYVCAVVAQPGRSFVQQLRDEPATFVRGYDRGLAAPDGSRRRVWGDEGAARATLYSDCDAAEASAAFARLRPQATGAYRVPCPLEALPDLPVASVVCAGDRVVDPAWSRFVARERLGIEPVEVPGGHSPWLSRPARLAELLTVVV